MNKTILVNGQWQGGADTETYVAAMQLRDYLAQNHAVQSVLTNLETTLIVKHGIKGCKIITEQIREALGMLHKTAPKKLLTVGGGCDADFASIAYMNEACNGDLVVVWMDGHGDINAPEESDSHLFYGMPIRALLGDCPPISNLAARPLNPDQVILLGSRDLDAGEEAYITKHDISLIPVLNNEDDIAGQLAAAIKKTGKSNVYIHLDLDVLDPGDFSDTPLPVADGYALNDILFALDQLYLNYTVVGTGLFEYKPIEHIPNELMKIIDRIERWYDKD